MLNIVPPLGPCVVETSICPGGTGTFGGVITSSSLGFGAAFKQIPLSISQNPPLSSHFCCSDLASNLFLSFSLSLAISGGTKFKAVLTIILSPYQPLHH